MELKALDIARRVHKGQSRRSGEAYIRHPARVAYFVAQVTKDSEVIAAAYLHDALEDSAKEGLERIRSLKKEIAALSPKVLAYVNTLTHNKKEDSYGEYIKKVSENDKILIVKLCDILDNLTHSPSEEQKEKYRHALVILFAKMQKSK